MSEEKFDAIVVGAGPAGVSAAIALAKAGLTCAVLERGEYPGAKNVQGAILYTKMLQDVVGEFWKDPSSPMERPITDQRVMLVSPDSAIQGGYKSSRWQKQPHNCYSIIRVHFDRWYAKKAEEAGAEIYSGVMVSDLVKKDGKVCGVKTSEGDELLADVVIACDGVNSILAQKAGLIDEWRADEVALGVKEVLALPQEKIDERFCLENGEGATIEMFGSLTEGMLGYGFLYTNKESLSLGIGCKLSHFQKSGIPPYDLLDRLKQHPVVRRLIQGSTPLEYSGHMIPEGGYHSMPPLFADGFLVAGDAAQMINPTHREGSNLTMTAGRLAGETVVRAKEKGDFSSRGLSSYQENLEKSFVIPDLYEIRNVENFVEERPELLKTMPGLLCESAFEFFTVDGRPKKDVHSSILKKAFQNKGVRSLMKKDFTFSNLNLLFKLALKGLREYRSGGN